MRVMIAQKRVDHQFSIEKDVTIPIVMVTRTQTLPHRHIHLEPPMHSHSIRVNIETVMAMDMVTIFQDKTAIFVQTYMATHRGIEWAAPTKMVMVGQM